MTRLSTHSLNEGSLSPLSSSDQVSIHAASGDRQRSPGGSAAGVMLVGHGTRDEQGSAQFFELGERVSERLAPIPVAPCLLEFQHPTLPEAWQRLVDAGVSEIRVAPLLLFAAGHAKEDIPKILQGCQAAAPEVVYGQSRPISRHLALVELVLERLRQTIDACSGEPERTAVVMTGRGSHDPCAQADMRVLSEIVASRVPVAKVTTAFYAMAEPKLPGVLDQIARSGRYRWVIVQPHLLFAGQLYQAICRRTGEAQQRYRDIDFAVSDYLGPDPRIVEAVAERIAEVAGCEGR